MTYLRSNAGHLTVNPVHLHLLLTRNGFLHFLWNPIICHNTDYNKRGSIILFLWGLVISNKLHVMFPFMVAKGCIRNQNLFPYSTGIKVSPGWSRDLSIWGFLQIYMHVYQVMVCWFTVKSVNANNRRKEINPGFDWILVQNPFLSRIDWNRLSCPAAMDKNLFRKSLWMSLEHNSGKISCHYSLKRKVKRKK